MSLKQGEVLHLLKGEYPHTITFKTINDDEAKNDNSTPAMAGDVESRKRSRSESNDSEASTKRLRDDVSDSVDENDDAKVREVEEKLKQMRESAEMLSASVTNKPQLAGAADSSVSTNGAPDIKGKPLDKAEWTEKDTLMVYHSKGLSSSSKVCDASSGTDASTKIAFQDL